MGVAASEAWHEDHILREHLRAQVARSEIRLRQQYNAEGRLGNYAPSFGSWPVRAVRAHVDAETIVLRGQQLRFRLDCEVAALVTIRSGSDDGKPVEISQSFGAGLKQWFDSVIEDCTEIEIEVVAGDQREVTQVALPTVERGASVSFHPRAVQKLYFEEGEFTSVPIFRPGEMNERCCVVCLSACVDTVLQPCRHMCLCAACAETHLTRSRSCPLCRSAVSTCVRLDDLEQVYRDRLLPMAEIEA
jgi:hypothetical protein